jgi:cation/acetate symporter
VLGLLGLFYVLPPVYGALGRLYAPDLVARGATDTVVLELPARMVAGTGGELLSALTAAGAFAAFLSTSSGLTIAVAGVVSQDVMGRRFRGVRAFQAAAVVAVAVPLLLAVSAEGVGVARAVGLAFAVAASTFCPLLVLGIWWRRLTDVGAISGMLVGGGLSGAAVVLTLVGVARDGWPGALVSQPAAWTVPAAFATMVLVSLLTPSRLPVHVNRTMVRLHTPEAVELDRGPQPL